LRELAQLKGASALAGPLVAGAPVRDAAGSTSREDRSVDPAVASRQLQALTVGGSAAQGSAKFLTRADGVTAFVAVNNLMPGPYRVAIHERGNCSSPNGFSAGKPWAPPGSARAAADLLPEIAIGPNGNGQMTAIVRGLKISGTESLEGRSVVVHAGPTVDANVVPDRPNRIVLCGVIGPVRSFRDAINFL
jgi:Cu/Zn superoxide dismutase